MKKVIIIGGGISGLAAGIYARQSGFDAEIIESHSIPGGFCTSWRRKGYLFEGGMHWLVGSSPKAPLNKLWQEVGALSPNTSIYNRDPFMTYFDGTKQICLYRDPERLRKHLLEVAPQDKEPISMLVSDIKKFIQLSMPISDIKGVKVKQKSAPPLSMMFGMMGSLSRMKKLNSINLSQYTSQFSHSGLRELLSSVVGNTEFSATSLIFTLSGLAAGDSGYPAGGSLQMAQNMADKFTSLGGKIHYNTRVEKITVESGKATGVFAGEFIPADAVIVTQDTLSAIDSLFEKPLNEEWVAEMRAEITPISCTFISLGIEANLSDMPENIIFPLARSIKFAGTEYTSIGLNNYANFKGYAPEGCTALTVVIMDNNYDFWLKAREDGSYAQKKQQLADEIVTQLAELIPQTAGKVAVTDVATPLTYQRYCGSFRGSWMSVLKPNAKRQQYPQVAESISGLYFAGQRTMLPGGMPSAATTGRAAVQYLCRDNNSVFQCNM